MMFIEYHFHILYGIVVRQLKKLKKIIQTFRASIFFWCINWCSLDFFKYSDILTVFRYSIILIYFKLINCACRVQIQYLSFRSNEK